MFDENSVQVSSGNNIKYVIVSEWQTDENSNRMEAMNNEKNRNWL